MTKPQVNNELTTTIKLVIACAHHKTFTCHALKTIQQCEIKYLIVISKFNNK